MLQIYPFCFLSFLKLFAYYADFYVYIMLIIFANYSESWWRQAITLLLFILNNKIFY